MTEIFFTDQGRGPAAVLIHGFPFDHRIWRGFAQRLSARCRVITIDLPGFGQSPLDPMTFSIDDIGIMVSEWLQARNYGPVTLVGHSLGGYVALSVAAHHPELLSALVLFHSTAYADSSEKKASRDKALTFIEQHGVSAFTSNFITPLFVEPRHPSIGDVRSIASDAREETVKGYLKAMRDRQDRTELLSVFPKPVQFIAGAKDRGITPESIREQAALTGASDVRILHEVAHMGMFEAESETVEILSGFIEKL